MKRVRYVLLLVFACWPGCGNPEDTRTDEDIRTNEDIAVVQGADLDFHPCNFNGVCDPLEMIGFCGDCGCNNNGVCQSARKETAANCHDCVMNCDFDWNCEPNETHTTCPHDCPPPCPTDRDQCTPSNQPLMPHCAREVFQVCSYDPWCCTNGWDNQCIREIGDIAARNTCGGGKDYSDLSQLPSPLPFRGGVCPSIYKPVKGPMPDGCGWLVTNICHGNGMLPDPYCCNNFWDTQCYAEAANMAGGPFDSTVNTPCGDGVCGAGENRQNCGFDCRDP